MSFWNRPALVFIATATALTACSSAAPGPSATPPSVQQSSAARDPASATSATSLSAAVSANNAFAVDLFGRVRATETGNLVTSPLSASLALTMAYAGARNETATQMATALHVDATSGVSIFDGQNALDQELSGRAASALQAAQRLAAAEASAGVPSPSADDYQLQIVNSMWGEQTYTWQPAFLDTMAKSYGAGVYVVDFIHQSEPARLAINAWVSSQTADKINDLLPPQSIDDTTRLVLVNAIHLKFPWAITFDASATAPSTFTTAQDAAVTAPFMNGTINLPYVDDGQAQIVALPLSNHDLSVVVALPHADVGLAAYETALSAGSAALAQPTAQGQVTLSLPKVTFTTPTFSLTSELKAMGMTDAFDGNLADFSGLSASPLYISDVLQKAMVALDESGAEAAAATAVVFATTGAPASPPPVTMTVDRPFLLSIVDNQTGAVLFLGDVQDPTQVGSP